MFRRDAKGKITYRDVGIFNRKRVYRFNAGKLHTRQEWEEPNYRAILERQMHSPVLLMTDGSSRKRWWMFRNDFYVEDEGYSEGAIQAIVLDRLQQHEKKVNKAMARLAQNTRQPISHPLSHREAILDDVKLFVWQRDRGRCVRCGSNVNLEYDHIIPLAKGGSNTARNIQLLCESCNRAKGANLF